MAKKEKVTSLENKAKKALELYGQTPAGVIVDADTILADAVESADFEMTGLGEETIRIWQRSSDRESVEQVFYNLAGIEFEAYLDRCIKETTKRDEK